MHCRTTENICFVMFSRNCLLQLHIHISCIRDSIYLSLTRVALAMLSICFFSFVYVKFTHKLYCCQTCMETKNISRAYLYYLMCFNNELLMRAFLVFVIRALFLQDFCCFYCNIYCCFVNISFILYFKWKENINMSQQHH